MNRLPIPPAATRDENSREMISAWVAENGLHCSLNIGMWETNLTTPEESAWGILLADVAQHVANALEQDLGKDRRETLHAIRIAFQEELGKPTSGHAGDFAHDESGE